MNPRGDNKMNKYKVANTFLKVVSDVIIAVAFIYGCYVLATPGYYGFMVAFIIVSVICVLLYLKLKRKTDESIEKRFPYKVDLIEHRFAMSYRKRFYKVWYLILLTVLNVVVFASISIMIYNQCNKEINIKYIESMEYITKFGFGDDRFNCEVFYKLAPLTPNSVKEGLSFCSDIMKYIDQLTRQLIEWKDEGDIDTAVLEEYKIQFEDYRNEMENS